MRILLSFEGFEQDETDVSTVEFDVDSGSIYVDGDVSRDSFLGRRLIRLAIRLVKFYYVLKENGDKK